MFIEALLIIANIWKQPKYPVIHEWIEDGGWIYIDIDVDIDIVKYYSDIKNEILLCVTTRMDLEGIKLGGIRQRQIPHDFTYMWILKKNEQT